MEPSLNPLNLSHLSFEEKVRRFNPSHVVEQWKKTLGDQLMIPNPLLDRLSRFATKNELPFPYYSSTMAEWNKILLAELLKRAAQ
jgi:hypothetical protein